MFGASDVFALGGFTATASFDTGVASLDHPEKILAVDLLNCLAKVTPDGHIIYVDNRGSQRSLKEFVPDSLRWDATATPPGWAAPLHPLDNDLNAFPTTAPFCSSFLDGAFVIQQGTGVIRAQCAGAWFDVKGAQIADATYNFMLAWNQSGILLGLDGSDAPFIVNPAGGAIKVTGYKPPGLGYSTFAARAHGAGFWVIAGSDSRLQPINERWYIDASGVAVKEGDYASIPAGYTLFDAPKVLDDQGFAYPIVENASDTLVARLPLAPAVSTVAFDPSVLPPNNYSTTPPNLHLIDPGCVITGP